LEKKKEEEGKRRKKKRNQGMSFSSVLEETKIITRCYTKLFCVRLKKKKKKNKKTFKKS